MFVFYKRWKKYNETLLTKKKIDLNNPKIIHPPPSLDPKRMNEMRRVFMGEVSGRRERGRQRLCIMVGVKVAMGSRRMTMKVARQ